MSAIDMVEKWPCDNCDERGYVKGTMYEPPEHLCTYPDNWCPRMDTVRAMGHTADVTAEAISHIRDHAVRESGARSARDLFVDWFDEVGAEFNDTGFLIACEVHQEVRP